jgi:hypothetical protein
VLLLLAAPGRIFRTTLALALAALTGCDYVPPAQSAADVQAEGGPVEEPSPAVPPSSPPPPADPAAMAPDGVESPDMIAYGYVRPRIDHTVVIGAGDNDLFGSSYPMLIGQVGSFARPSLFDLDRAGTYGYGYGYVAGYRSYGYYHGANFGRGHAVSRGFRGGSGGSGGHRH